MKTELTMTTPLPPAHEPLPADFLREHGAQKDMKFWSEVLQEWQDSVWNPENDNHRLWENARETNLYCAPIGTIAATTPLPGPRCDCGCDLGYGDEGYSHLPSCSIHRTYHHILPAALAALPEKPEGLVWTEAGRLEWRPMPFDWFIWKEHYVELNIYAYAIPAQSGQGKEYRVTCPHCLGQQKANGAVCLECNGIGYWMNPYPLSTQPEGGEECADIIVPAAPASNATQPDSASNAAPANVLTVAGSGQAAPGEKAMCEGCGIRQPRKHLWLSGGHNERLLCPTCITPPSPPSTAGETPISDAAAYWPGCSQCTDAGILVVPLETARALERQLAAVTAQHQMAEMEVRDVVKVNDQHQATMASLRTQLAAVTAWKDEISAAIQRSGLGIMRTSQGPAGTMICTRPEVKDAEDRKVLELINENIDLESRLTAATAERDEARKRLEISLRDQGEFGQELNEIYRTLGCPDDEEIDPHKFTIEALTALRTDSHRLDWLEANQRALIPCFGKNPPMGSGLPIPFEGYTLTMTDPTPKTLRAAIDAAMKGDK